MRQVVLVLHAHDLGDTTAFRDLGRRHVAQPDVTHESLTLQIGQHRERRFDRTFCRPVHVEHDAQVHDVDHVQAEVAQIVVHGLRELFTRVQRGFQEASAPRLRADLGDDDQIVAIGRQRLANRSGW